MHSSTSNFDFVRVIPDVPWRGLVVAGLQRDPRLSALDWFRTLKDHFRRTAWLNPDKEQYWYGTVQISRVWRK